MAVAVEKLISCRYGLYPAVRQKVLDQTGFDLDTLPGVRSGRDSGTPGKHVIFRSTESRPRQLGLAMAKVPETEGYKTIVDFMGEGSQTVAAGSLHKSGRIYTVEHGDTLNPPVIDAALMDQIIEVIKSFDETDRQDRKVHVKRERSYVPNPNSPSVIQEYNSRTPIEDVLQAHGYEPTHGDFYNQRKAA